jgi:hypothetical protein
VPNAIDELNRNPDADERSGNGPMAVHRPNGAPESECHEREIDDDETGAMILRNQTGPLACTRIAFFFPAMVSVSYIG